MEGAICGFDAAVGANDMKRAAGKVIKVSKVTSEF